MKHFGNLIEFLLYVMVGMLITGIAYYMWHFPNGYCQENIIDGASYQISIPGWRTLKHPTQCIEIIGKLD